MLEKKRILLTIAYDGTAYSGWQKQKDTSIPTIEGNVEQACRALFRNNALELIGASRTDASVHALGQRAVLDVETSIPTTKIPFAIRSFLPADIVVKKAEEVPITFHPRYDCIKKTYVYQLYQDDFPNPLLRHHAVFLPQKLDILAMNRAASYLIGTHDFQCFCAAGSSVSSTVRTIFDCHIEQKDNFLSLFITGDGFLYNMVRIITGTLIDVGKGKKQPQDLQTILESKDRTKAGMTAPPQGLTLLHIFYPNM